MILIFSVLNDYTTYEVVKWLHHMGHKDVVRINSDEKKSINFKLQNDHCELTINDQHIDLNKITAVWYRKGANWFGQQFEEVRIDNHLRLSHCLNQISANENKVLNDYIHFLIKRKVPVLGSAFKSNLNKLMTLDQARSVGLSVPDFHVLNSVNDIDGLINSSKHHITKTMSDGVYLFDSEDSETGCFTYTEDLDQDRIKGLPDKIAPSFIQSKIDKKYEIRSFFIEDDFYSWAILSQNDERTKTDFRKYNGKKPNRNLAVEIPDEVQHKLKKLFELIGLNTGSIDLMVDMNDKYYFLEINPVGQFGFLSKLTNYQLEKQVAIWLSQYER